MSLINRMRVEGRHGVPTARNPNPGGVSGVLRQQLGEELAAMLERVGRKTYAAAMERIKRAMGEALMANKSVLTASLRQEFGRRGFKDARAAVHSWLDEIVGDVLTDVAEEVYSDLPDIADALVEETSPDAQPEEPVVGQDDEEEVEVDEEEELEEEPEEGTFEPEAAGDNLEAIADELEEIKAAGMAQAAKLAAGGHSDDAAYLRMVLEQL